MPYLSRVPLAGLSLAEAQVKIATMLRDGQFIRNPQVRIEVDQFKSRNVLVTGEVRTPGKVTLPGSTMSVLEALALAGSPTNNASNEVIVIHPPKPGEQSPEPITINRRDLELGRAGRDITLQDGDIVNVPVAKRFYISGFVKNPGSYVLDTGTTVSQAIILAGGLAERGTDRRIQDRPRREWPDRRSAGGTGRQGPGERRNQDPLALLLMCGIAGVVRHGGAVGADPAAALDAALAHRGPDGSGAWRSPARRRRSWSTGASRSSTPGRPARSRWPRPTAVIASSFNGEIYNYRELRRSLEARGERFTTGSDTEVLLRLLACDGPDALAGVRGMFALAWWDAASRSLARRARSVRHQAAVRRGARRVDRVRVRDSGARLIGARRAHDRSGRRARLSRLGNGAADADLRRRRRKPGAGHLGALERGRQPRAASLRGRGGGVRAADVGRDRIGAARAGRRGGAGQRRGAPGRGRAGRHLPVRRHRFVGDSLGGGQCRRLQPQHLYGPLRRSLVGARVRAAGRIDVRRDAPRARPRPVAHRLRSAAHHHPSRSADARRRELVLRFGRGGGDRHQGGAVGHRRRRAVRRLSLVPSPAASASA